MENLRFMSREKRSEAFKLLGEASFREKQLFSWQCRKVCGFEEMTDFSSALRKKLSESYSFEGLKILKEQISKDGTRKYLLGLLDGNSVEAVFMQYEYGNSLCISSQVGCNMGCRFCASTIGGKIRNLTAMEMLEEVFACERAAGADVNHIVLMGMGEPFDNYEELKGFLELVHEPKGKNLSYRNITVSTCGLIPKIEEFGNDFPGVNLAISLHASTQEEREALMPIAKRFEIHELISCCKKYTEKTSRRVSFEYTLIEGKNDSKEHAKSLASLLRGMLCHVNLIPLNPVEESGMKGSSDEAARLFASRLEALGIPATVRRKLGRDIDAACGQLRKKQEDLRKH